MLHRTQAAYVVLALIACSALSSAGEAPQVSYEISARIYGLAQAPPLVLVPGMTFYSQRTQAAQQNQQQPPAQPGPAAGQETQREALVRSAEELRTATDRLREAQQAPAGGADTERSEALADLKAETEALLRSAQAGEAGPRGRPYAPVSAEQVVWNKGADVCILIGPSEETLKQYEQGKLLGQPTVVTFGGFLAKVSMFAKEERGYLRPAGEGLYELASVEVPEGYEMTATIYPGQDEAIRLAFSLRRPTIVGREKVEGLPDDLGNLGPPVVDDRRVDAEWPMKLNQPAILVIPGAFSGAPSPPSVSEGGAEGEGQAAATTPEQPAEQSGRTEVQWRSWISGDAGMGQPAPATPTTAIILTVKRVAH
jgi:hypothetical protein